MDLSEIKTRLSSIVNVKTLVKEKANIIHKVESKHVVVISEKTGKKREIPYKNIINHKNVTANSAITKTLASILGIK